MVKDSDWPTSDVATSTWLATCNKCESLLAHGESKLAVSSEVTPHKIQGHEVWVGLMTVGAMVEWLEILLEEAGLRD